MGRVKLEIKKIENPANRQVTYSKRQNGLMKKAFELSVLCDVDVAVITFSPSGKLTQFCNDDRIEEVITRYANTPQPERTKRKLQNVEYLDKAVKKLTDERGLEAPKVSYENLQLEVQKPRSQLYTAMVERNFLEQERRQLQGLDVIQNTLEKTSFQMNPSGADVQGSGSDVIQNTLEQTSFEMNPSGADFQGSSSNVIQNTLEQTSFEMNPSGRDFQGSSSNVIQNTLEQTSFEMNPSGAYFQGSSFNVIQNTLEQTSFEMNPSGADFQGGSSDVMQNTLKHYLFEMNSSGADFQGNSSLYTDLEELFFDSLDVRVGQSGLNV